MLFGTNVGMFSTHYLVQLLHFLNAHADILGSIYSIVLTDFAKAFDWITQFLLRSFYFGGGVRSTECRSSSGLL